MAGIPSAAAGLGIDAGSGGIDGGTSSTATGATSSGGTRSGSVFNYGTQSNGINSNYLMMALSAVAILFFLQRKKA